MSFFGMAGFPTFLSPLMAFSGVFKRAGVLALGYFTHNTAC